MVDGVQSLGVLDLDVSNVSVDAFAAATSKSLLGLYGMGILYCKDPDQIHPASLPRFGVDLGDVNYVLAAGARRFELGNHNCLAVHALDASLDHITEIGLPQIEQHALALSTSLANGVRELGYKLISPPSLPEASHVVVFCPPPAGPSIAEVSAILNSAQVTHTVRRFGLWLSFHLHNNASDAERVLDALPRVGCLGFRSQSVLMPVNQDIGEPEWAQATPEKVPLAGRFFPGSLNATVDCHHSSLLAQYPIDPY